MCVWMCERWDASVVTNYNLKVQFKNTVYTVLLHLYVADPATFLASDCVVQPYFPLRTACLFTDEKNVYYYLINIVNI